MTTTVRASGELYAPEQLVPMVRPASVAVIGVSQDPSRFGSRTLMNLVGGGFEGEVYPVNPAHDRLHGHRCYPSIGDVPQAVDCAIIAVPRSAVLEVAAACAAAQARTAIVMSSGFGETAAAGGQSDEAVLRELAARTGMLICGPNTQGHVNLHDGIGLTFVPDFQITYDPGAVATRAASIGIVSQSGGLGAHLAHVRHRGVPVSHLLCAGNSCDVTIFDLANFLLDDHDTRAVAVIGEGVTDGRLIASLGRRSRQTGKAVVYLPIGRTSTGRSAARSHTGNLTGDARVLSAALSEAGIVEVSSPEDLLETSMLFARTRRPKAPGVAVVSTTGGAGVLCADAADDFGVPLEPPGPSTARSISSLLPTYAAVRNPFDLTADALNTPESYEKLVQTIREDPAFGAVVVPVSLTLGPATAARPASIERLARDGETPIVALWMSQLLEAAGSEVLDASPHVPTFRSATRCFRALASWQWWHDFQPPSSSPEPLASGTVASIRSAVDGVLARRDATEVDPQAVTLTEAESRSILAAAGVVFPRAGLADTPDEAARVAGALGYPVCVKIVSDQVAHKAAIGGVRLGLDTAADVARAGKDVLAEAKRQGVGSRIRLLVVEMVAGETEILVGARRDHAFGGVAVCGLGGTRAETLDLVEMGLVPMSRERGASLVDRLVSRTGVVLDTAARSALVDLTVRVGAVLGADVRIAEIDLNPVLVGSATKDAIAVDALVRIEPSPTGR